MTITPPPPTDLSGLVEAFAQTTGAVLDLAGGLDESRAGLATECPGWTVLDQVRHVASIEALILGEPVPDHDVSSHAHVRNDFGVIIEKYLEGRRARSLQDVVDELTEVRERRLADLGAPDQTLESPSASPSAPPRTATCCRCGSSTSGATSRTSGKPSGCRADSTRPPPPCRSRAG